MGRCRVSVPGRLGLVLLTITLLAACSAPGPTTTVLEGSTPRASSPAATKRITAAIQGDVTVLMGRYDAGRSIPGADTLEDLISAGLTSVDVRGLPLAQIAEAVPTLENGQWELLPDGRMRTAWTLKPNARWHDGTAVTSADLLFTSRVGADRDIAQTRNVAYDFIENVEAPDARSVTVTWKQPFIDADVMFNRSALPLPSHLLEAAYTEQKGSFSQLPYWGEEFVGTGPFKVREWVRSSYVLLEANPDYVMGRPKVDQIEVRFIPDGNALLANILSDSVELTLGRSLSVDQAIQVRDQWLRGRIEMVFRNWIAAFPQLMTPNPSVIGDVRFRRALLHATDRQQMVDELQAGLSQVAHHYLAPGDNNYADTERFIGRYEYDPPRAVRMIQELGYTRAPDGFFRDAAGSRLGVEIRTTAGDDLQEKSMFAASEFWRRAGVYAEPTISPRQLQSDREYRANFPGFEMVRQPNDVNSIRRGFHSSNVPLAENNYVGVNRVRYANPEFDALIDRYYTTIPRPQRLQIAGEKIHFVLDQVLALGMFYNTEPSMIGARLENVVPRVAEGTTHAWNAHLWDVK